jgi:hypothetical protein
MRRLTCRCGHAIVLSVIPVEGEVAYLPTSQWDDLVAALGDAATRAGTGDVTLLREALSDAVATSVAYFYRCPQCDRLIFPSQRGGEPEYYVREP